MLKACSRSVFFICLLSAFIAHAQKADTIKRDTVKIDTAQLNKYRIDPRPNALPSITRPISISPKYIPTAMLNYKVSYWHKWVTFSLNFNQSAFSNNYAAGGTNAVALGTNFDYKAEYNKTPFDYTTETNLIYGISKNKGQGARKTNDRIFFDNKVASQITKHWLLFGSLTFESQFSRGYQYGDGVTTPNLVISNFMSPGYITESTGLEYKPNKFFDLRLGVASAKQTFVLDTAIYHNIPGNYGVDTSKINGVNQHRTFHNDLATQIVATFDKDVMKNLHLNARYALFIPYGRPVSFITHRLDATLVAKVNSIVAVTINGTFLYDKTTSPDPQETEGLALGVIYKFP